MKIDLRLPWSLAPLRSKYYGTVIVDRDGNEVMEIWRRGETDEEQEPSPREEIASDETDWKEWFDWSHYESMLSYLMAKEIVDRMNR